MSRYWSSKGKDLEGFIKPKLKIGEARNVPLTPEMEENFGMRRDSFSGTCRGV